MSALTKRLHPIAATVSLFGIAGFWTITVWVELTGRPDQVVAVKTMLPWAFLVLIPALALTGATGFARAKGRTKGAIGAKRARMPLIAANGVLVLVPSALFLAARAANGQFDTAFYVVQTVELVFGAVNLILLTLSFRDGLRLTGRVRRRPAV